MFFSSLGFIVAVVASPLLARPISVLVNNIIIAPRMCSAVTFALTDKSINILDKLPGYLTSNGVKFGFDADALIDRINASSFGNSIDTANGIVDKFISPVIVNMIEVVVTIILFIILSLIFSLITRRINLIIKSTPARAINAMLGMLAGVFFGGVFVCLFCLFTNAVLTFSKEGFFIFTESYVKNSYIYANIIKFLV